jgi:AraC-like DNA-binding protein
LPVKISNYLETQLLTALLSKRISISFMNVIAREPSAPLHLFIDKFWAISAGNFDQQDIGLPVMRHEFMFNFSDHFSICQTDSKPLIDDQTTWINSLYTHPQRSTTRGRHETFGVFLKPWALYSLTNIPASELTNQVIESSLVFHQPIRDLTEQFRETNDMQSKLTLLEYFLLSHFSGKDLPAYLPYAVDYLQKRPWHDGIVRDLAMSIGVSPKSLTQAFNKYVGVSPGRFLHIRLVNEVTADLANNPNQSLTELAYRHRFFDQAHLNHLFKSLTNLTPGQYQKQVLAGTIDKNDPCYIRQTT